MKRLHVKKLLLATLVALGLLVGGGRALAYGPRAWPAYHWPVKPFNVQHPVQAVLGDPRTVYLNEPFGRTGPNRDGAYSFHNGVDISAPGGTPVYPVVSGRVIKAIPDEIIVRTNDGRTFQYYHLDRAVNVGAWVVAQRTIVGTVKVKYGHVHLAEIDGTLVQNPLAIRHLAPYHDWTKPTVDGLYVDNGGGPRALVAGQVGVHDTLVVAATDPPAQPLAGNFAQMPQVPALVEWRLFHGGRSATAWKIAADFRQTEPPPRLFWRTYAAGTYQNIPVFDHRCFTTTPGRYLFRLGLDTARYAGGSYRLEVRVTDIRRNSSVSFWPLQIGTPPVTPS